MIRTTIDEREWEDLKKQVKQHEEYFKKQKQQIRAHSEVAAISTNLDPRENDIFKFISENPHCNKADVERHFKGKIARQTIFNIIDNLVEYGIVRDEINEKNRQTRSLVINTNSELASLIQQLDQFEEIYFLWLDKLKDGFEDQNKSIFEKYRVFEDVVSIYESFAKPYLMQGAYIWPKKINDAEYLSKLYTTLLTRLYQIQLGLAERSRVIFERYDLIENIVLNSTRLPVSKEAVLKSSKEFHIEKELANVLRVVENGRSKVAQAAFRSSSGKVRIDDRDYPGIRIGGKGNQAISRRVRPEKRKGILYKP